MISAIALNSFSPLGDATSVVAPERVLVVLDQEMADEIWKTWELEAYSQFPTRKGNTH
jgi:hypothetical protein